MTHDPVNHRCLGLENHECPLPSPRKKEQHPISLISHRKQLEVLHWSQELLIYGGADQITCLSSKFIQGNHSERRAPAVKQRELILYPLFYHLILACARTVTLSPSQQNPCETRSMPAACVPSFSCEQCLKLWRQWCRMQNTALERQKSCNIPP